MNAISHIRKRRGQGAERRPEILAAAKRLFLEEGYERATMRRIASEVGVSATALYVYFPDKDSILRAIAEATFADMLAALEASQDPAAPPIERFRAGLRAYIAFGRARPDEYRLTFLAKMIRGAVPGPVCEATIEAADRSFGILERGVRGLMETNVLPPGDSVLVAEAIWACLHGVTALIVDHAGHLESDPDAIAEAVIALTTNYHC